MPTPEKEGKLSTLRLWLEVVLGRVSSASFLERLDVARTTTTSLAGSVLDVMLVMVQSFQGVHLSHPF
jgi:hypothetical protein